MAAVATIAELQAGVSHASGPAGAPGSSDEQQQVLLEHQLGLAPHDVVSHVVLLATLPEFRRAGVASQLFGQVLNNARNLRWGWAAWLVAFDCHELSRGELWQSNVHSLTDSWLKAVDSGCTVAFMHVVLSMLTVQSGTGNPCVHR
jgi:GNAT superfamily N-acetyltransferase